MAKLPAIDKDPTLEAMDRCIEERARQEPRRNYLGMSAIGHPCERKLYYDYRSTVRKAHDAATLKRFEDGHRGEALMADRLRLVHGITLLTVDPETGKQFGFQDHDGEFRGHMDGAIHGLLQASAAWHCWEHKCVKEEKQAKLVKLKAEKGEKNALAEWDEIYYAQAMLYLHYSGMDRHYLTVSTPGERSTVSCRTDANPEVALKLIEKAKRIIDAPFPLARISNDPSWWQCRWCDHIDTCHKTGNVT